MNANSTPTGRFAPDPKLVQTKSIARFVVPWGAVVLGLVVITAPWLMVLGPNMLADFTHREAVYASIVQRAEKIATSKTEFVRALFSYVQAHIFVFPGQKLNQFDLSSPPLSYLKLQSGWCDQQGGVLLTLARRGGIDGKLVVLLDELKSPAHVVSTLEIDGEPRILDPYYGLLFIGPTGRLASVEEVINTDFRQHGLAAPQYDGAVLYGDIDTKRELDAVLSLLQAPRALVNQTLDYSGIRRVISRIVFFYHELLGDGFLKSIQSVYFYSRQLGGYERARYLQLAGRFEDAADGYRALLERGDDAAVELPEMIYSPSKPHGPGKLPAVVRFSLGQTLWSEGLYKQAEREFQILLARYPDSGWAQVARYFLGDVYYRLGDLARAKRQWLMQVGNPSLPTLQRLYEIRNTKLNRI